jgi:enamine deaminase RidA (YjgF/YER057c/UK114 family)
VKHAGSDRINRPQRRQRLDVVPSRRLKELGLVLPKPWTLPKGVKVTGPVFVHIVGTRVLVSGHVPIGQNGSVVGPFGKVGRDISEAIATKCAQRAMLGILASLVRTLGSLDRINSWVRLFGMVNASDDFTNFPAVVNGASALLHDVFGAEVGAHARVAIGVAGLPFNAPVEIEAELTVRDA